MDLNLIDGNKIGFHLDRVAQAEIDPINTFPIYVEISPMGGCNHRCTFCAVDYIGYKSQKMDLHRLETTLINMVFNGVRSVMFAGEGEPLLHPEIAEICNICNSLGLDFSFTTNGVYLNKLVRSEYSHLKWVKVSCNAGTPRTYSEIHKCKPTDFSKVWDNLREFKQTCHRDTKVGVQMVLLPENSHEVQNLAYLAYNGGLDYIVVKPYSQHKSSFNKRDVLVLTKPSWALELEKSGFQVVWRDNAMLEASATSPSYNKCLATPFYWAYIMATGDVYGCSAYLLDERFRYGNINEQLFSDIWTGPLRAKSIEYVKNTLNIKECRVNCRMDKVNKALHLMEETKVVAMPHVDAFDHRNFI